MSAWLTSKWRKGAAALLVALYALCVVTPVAALAASDGAMAAHCLSEGHRDMAAHHGDGAGHPHSLPGDDDRATPAKCCGLFGVSAIAPSFNVVATPMARATDVAMPPAASLFGRSSDRIDRPPRFLLSL